MASRYIAFVTGALVFLVLAPVLAQSHGEWIGVDDPAELRALVADRTFKDAWGTKSYFRVDGKGLVVHPAGTRVRRTWEVKGKDLVCATADAGGTECWRVQRHRQDAGKVQFVYENGVIMFQTVEAGVADF